MLLLVLYVYYLSPFKSPINNYKREGFGDYDLLMWSDTKGKVF